MVFQAWFGCTLLGIIFFLRSLYSKFLSVRRDIKTTREVVCGCECPALSVELFKALDYAVGFFHVCNKLLQLAMRQLHADIFGFGVRFCNLR